MKANRLVLAGSFCWNKDCPDYGITDRGNIVKYGKTGKGTQRLKCTTCERVFVMEQGSVSRMLGITVQKKNRECLAMLADRNSLAAIQRIKGIKEETVMDWLREAANHMEDSNMLNILTELESISQPAWAWQKILNKYLAYIGRS